MLDSCLSLLETVFPLVNAPSKLEPFRKFIADERRRGTTYRRLAELLAEKGVEVDYSTIHAFVKVRSKPQRRVITMWEESPENTSAVDVATQAERRGTIGVPERASAQREAIRRLKNAKPNGPRRAKGLASFKPDAPLDRVSEKEAKRLRDELHGK
jgi:hypothetical protein